MKSRKIPVRIFLILQYALLSLISSGQGEKIFESPAIHEVRIATLFPSAWDSIVNRYAPKIYTPVRVEIDGTTLDSVGIRIKGNSFLPSAMGADKYQPFRLKFSKFRSWQRFDGLKDINLHMHDLLTNYSGYNIWRTTGLVAPRTSFAKVWFDNSFLGMYMFVDEMDKIFLNKNFGNDDGNLFKADGKGAYLGWLGPEQNAYSTYVLETNESKNDKSDLIQLLNAIHNTPDAVLSDSISKYLNLDAFIKSMAIEMFICKRDAFYDSGHNYFLYHNTSTNKFEYLPWDLDMSFQTLDGFNLNFIGQNGTINNPFILKILNNVTLRNNYYQTVCNLLKSNALNSLRLENLIDSEESRLNAASMSFNQTRGFSIANVKTFLHSRQTTLENDFSKSGFQCNPGTGTAPISMGKVVIFPNPVAARLYFNGIPDQTVVTFSDQYGRWVHSERITGNYVDISCFPEGIYFLKILLGEEMIHAKIIRAGY